MIVAVASGKGGTGKTTVAVNLAATVKDHVLYIDADVEEPDGHLFLKPHIEKTENARVTVPRIDEKRCTLCGDCAAACRFNALLVSKENVLVFNELCHGCGTCSVVCPENAVHEVERDIGIISYGQCGDIQFISGTLNIGEAMATPLIRQVKEEIAGRQGLTIVDASPGTSCPVIEAVRDTDYVILVTEPTPFGLSDLTLAVEMVRSLGIPLGIIINRSSGEDEILTNYIRNEKLEVLAEIPLKRSIAEIISRGDLLVENDSEMRKIFQKLSKQVVS
jgi:MinD superfamily P-loop ATPase